MKHNFGAQFCLLIFIIVYFIFGFIIILPLLHDEVSWAENVLSCTEELEEGTCTEKLEEGTSLAPR